MKIARCVIEIEVEEESSIVTISGPGFEYKDFGDRFFLKLDPEYEKERNELYKFCYGIAGVVMEQFGSVFHEEFGGGNHA